MPVNAAMHEQVVNDPNTTQGAACTELFWPAEPSFAANVHQQRKLCSPVGRSRGLQSAAAARQQKTEETSVINHHLQQDA
jgi:hypothetical protein